MSLNKAVSFLMMIFALNSLSHADDCVQDEGNLIGLSKEFFTDTLNTIFETLQPITYDKHNKLHWYGPADKSLNYSEAVKYCESLKVERFKDVKWQVPGFMDAFNANISNHLEILLKKTNGKFWTDFKDPEYSKKIVLATEMIEKTNYSRPMNEPQPVLCVPRVADRKYKPTKEF